MKQQRWEESEKRKEEEIRSEKRRVSRKKIKVRKKVEKSRNPEDGKRGHLQRFVFVFSDGADNVDPKFFL
jgi:hypothetical protein